MNGRLSGCILGEATNVNRSPSVVRKSISGGEMSPSLYYQKRALRPLYASATLHLAALRLMLCLLITPSQVGVELEGEER